MLPIIIIHTVIIQAMNPVAQLVEHRVIMRKVVSSTPAGPTLKNN